MEVFIRNKTIAHEVKLKKSIIVILGVIAFELPENAIALAICVNPAFSDKWGEATFYLQQCGDIDLK